MSGPPATGKTALAHTLAARLTLPLYSRDVIKEALFDTLGWSDRQRSKELGAASAAVLFAQLTATLGAGASCLVESNYRRSLASADFQQLITTTGARPLQIQCVTDGEVLLRRFTDRAATIDRHPGHGDDHNVDEFRADLLTGRYEPLDLPGPVLTVDTTDFTTLPLDHLITTITAQLTTDVPPPA
ncbi:AAA family ATPase [Amycolatopsis magusensis]|uniref:AAA family ATPase n=1 Tax=Amycolatopsis magusensis TaxID=882444 RepID=UPI0037B9B37A